MQAKDVPTGAIFYTSERLGDDRNSMEVREVYYVRDADTPCRYPHNVRVGRIAIIQGDPDGLEPPRYRRVNSPACRDPGEMDGRTTVHLVREHAGVWAQSI